LRLDRLDVDLVAHDAVPDRLVHAHSLDRELDGLTLRAAQLAHRIVRAPAARRAAVDLDDPVPRLQPRPLRRRAWQRRDDRDPAVADVDLRADPRILALRLHAERVVILRRHERRVRVAQLVDQAVDRHAVQRRRILRIDVPVGYVMEYFVEEPRLEVFVPFLAHPALP